MREYLCRVGAEITDRSLAEITSKAEWAAARPERYAQYMEMQGVPIIPPRTERSPLNVTITGTLERGDIRIEKLYYEALPGLYVTGNLYIPQHVPHPAPAVLYVCGHSLDQKTHYQPHARRWAELGFVTLLVETIQRGEIKGYHHGCYGYGQFQWYSRGYTPGGVEMWNAIRAADLLEDRAEVDGERIGITGASGGGAVSWWAGAADERFKVVAPVCGTGTLKAHVRDRTWDGHCDCMMFINTYQQELSDCGALIAPRPLMIGSAERDGIFSIESIHEVYEKVRRIYELNGAADDCHLETWPGPHGYMPLGRQRIFAFFMKHLMGKDVAPEEIADVGEKIETSEDLRVYVNGIPSDEQVSTVQEYFVPKAAAPEIHSLADLQTARAELIANLHEKTFGHFPAEACALETEVHLEWAENNGSTYQRLAFTTEPGIRIHAQLNRPGAIDAAPAPTLIFLRDNRDDRWQFESFTGDFSRAWNRLAVDCRGVGETSWGADIQWHIRRAAAITGRTIASMQVHDTLRALAMCRQLSAVNGERIILTGRGQMAVVALYAALLDGNIEAVVMENPPATQDAPDDALASGLAIEMLNCLRFTDLPYVAGMLHPTDLVFVNPRPASYAWTEELYRQFGGTVRHVKTLGEYAPGRK